MVKKAFAVQVEIDITTVNCPGVWLCPYGKVSLQLYVLNSCVQSSKVEPIFPLNIQERFTFYKTFSNAQKLECLQRSLSGEVIYVELVQWQHNEGNVLATFYTTLLELLYPSTSHKKCSIDLLMKPMENFPGILAPKIAVNTKTHIEDIFLHKSDKNNENFCECKRTKRKIHRQKRVCHSYKEKYILNGGDIFFDKIMPDSSNVACACKEIKEGDFNRKCFKEKISKDKCQCVDTPCIETGDDHNEDACIICARYRKLFRTVEDQV